MGIKQAFWIFSEWVFFSVLWIILNAETKNNQPNINPRKWFIKKSKKKRIIIQKIYDINMLVFMFGAILFAFSTMYDLIMVANFGTIINSPIRVLPFIYIIIAFVLNIYMAQKVGKIWGRC